VNPCTDFWFYFRAGDAERLSAARLSLGRLGVLTEIALRCEPMYQVKRHVHKLDLDGFASRAGASAIFIYMHFYIYVYIYVYIYIYIYRVYIANVLCPDSRAHAGIRRFRFSNWCVDHIFMYVYVYMYMYMYLYV